MTRRHDGPGPYPVPPPVRPRRRRAGSRVVIGTAAVVVLAAGGFLVVRGLSENGSAQQQPPTEAMRIPSSVGTAVPTPTAQPTVAPLAESTPVQVEIPSIGVNAPVMKLGLSSDGSIQVPPLSNHNLAGWYDGSVTPGQDGSSVIIGHVDSYSGTSVFYSIKTLHRGDTVKVIRADGSTAAFAVDGVQKVVKTTFPTRAVYGNVSYPSLRLVTCGGPFDSATGQYLDNIVVYAHLVS